MTRKPLERDVTRAILDYCAAERIFIRRRNVAGAQKLSGGRYVNLGKKGMSDLWGIMPKSGRHFECEVKREGETPRQNQEQWLAECADAGGLSFWCDSLEDFIEVMTGELF